MNSGVNFVIAFSAGVLSFLSPCVLPLIPSYVTLLLGDYAEKKGENRPLTPALIFILGFTIVFMTLGMSASLLGKVLIQNQIILRKVSGVIIIILGLHLSGILKIKTLYREKTWHFGQNLNKYLRALVMGIGLALAWTPCIGPVLSSILIYASTSSTILQGGMLLFFYSAGFAIPFILTAVFFNWLLPRYKKLNPYLPTIQTITGILIIILGILIYTNYIQVLSQI
ncbi:cytochrome c biogenesis CcdA family protein [Halothermothrix orenii]|uniref:Cytochrome c biogenesis protein transmembrane region n=1 Tax=Halothermothrix orenii (strain H 168 / OCM 544 / DSM 9562) TaxID=373903 RepID=B8CZ49_HALOH|nr:cytochrome c biogenesis protein CcdA [Halothermothrix orenii]ACL70568.1 cytochrome c biogenesis protein transmembrane region [Halothermothrix orenii H 168]